MVSIITIIFATWTLRVPNLVKGKALETGGFRTRYAYRPVGLQIWHLILIIGISLVPMLNIILIIAMIIAILMIKAETDQTWKELIPEERTGKIFKFFTKTIK